MSIDKNEMKLRLITEINRYIIEKEPSFIREFDKEIEETLNELLDIQKPKISNLTYFETYLVRRKLGILNDGKIESLHQIAFELYEDIERIKKIENKAYSYIIQAIKNKARTSSYEINVENDNSKEQKPSLLQPIIKEKKKDDTKLDIEQIKELPYEEKIEVNLRKTDISRQIINPLLRSGIETIGDLIKYNRDYLLNIRNFGNEKRQFIYEFIYYIGLVFKDEDQDSKDSYLEERLNILLREKKLCEDKLDRIKKEMEEIRDRISKNNNEDIPKIYQK